MSDSLSRCRVASGFVAAMLRPETGIDELVHVCVRLLRLLPHARHRCPAEGQHWGLSNEICTGIPGMAVCRCRVQSTHISEIQARFLYVSRWVSLLCI